jgi:16S rRNA (guanine(1405)-N(7))-methyltransferase
MSDPLAEIVAEVLGSAKYRTVSPELVRATAARELAAHRSRKDAVKAVKNKLHQVAGAYFDGKPAYDEWLRLLTSAATEHTLNDTAESQRPTLNAQRSTPNPQPPSFRAPCQEIMRRHASTRERLPILERFYAECLAGLPPIRSVLDLACGMNPLALPWMPLAPDVRYHACDIYADLADFLTQFFTLANVTGRAEVCDLSAGSPDAEADLALVLKAMPVLEQLDRAAPLRLLRGLKARFVLVSFPAQSLGGRGKGMAETYERRFTELVANENWAVRPHRFRSEVAFLVDKAAGCVG